MAEVFEVSTWVVLAVHVRTAVRGRTLEAAMFLVVRRVLKDVPLVIR